MASSSMENVSDTHPHLETDFKVKPKTEATNELTAPSSMSILTSNADSKPEVACVVKIEIQEDDFKEVNAINPLFPMDLPPATIKRKRGRPPSLKTVKKVKESPKRRKKISRGQPGRPRQNTSQLKQEISCEICQKTFATKRYLTIHTNNIHIRAAAGELFKCDLCDYTASYKVTLNRHFKTKHLGEPLNKHPCIFCNRMLFDTTDLYHHLRTHTLEKPYFCKLCDKSFSIRSNLMSHLKRTHNSERERPWNCSSCPKSFFTEHELQLHFRGIHRKEKRFQCQLCPKRFTTSSDLKRHQTKHSVERNFKCEVCGTSFKSKTNLKGHLIIHTKKKKFKCEVCGKRFKTNSNLRVHRFIHEPQKRFECKVCGKLFQQRGGVRIHIKSHSVEQPYRCEICDVGFNLSTNLNRHKKSPTHLAKLNNDNKSQSHSCKECKKVFSTDRMLKRHHSIEHLSESEKIHECGLCENKRFSCKQGLQHHVKVFHFGERSKCPHCQQSFTSPVVMRRHVKKHCKNFLQQ